jgi:hypothetical protein
MFHKGLLSAPARLSASRAVVAVAILAMALATAAAPAHAREATDTTVAVIVADETFDATLDPPPSPPKWPEFSDALDDQNSPPMVMPGWPADSVIRANAISAPLPQAVATGIFMLGGNWVVTRLWKKRKL